VPGVGPESFKVDQAYRKNRDIPTALMGGLLVRVLYLGGKKLHEKENVPLVAILGGAGLPGKPIKKGGLRKGGNGEQGRRKTLRVQQ